MNIPAHLLALPTFTLGWAALKTAPTAVLQAEVERMEAAEATLLEYRREVIASCVDRYNITAGDILTGSDTAKFLAEVLYAAQEYQGPIHFLSEELEDRRLARAPY